MLFHSSMKRMTFEPWYHVNYNIFYMISQSF
jgi:hypothetical protein